MKINLSRRLVFLVFINFILMLTNSIFSCPSKVNQATTSKMVEIILDASGSMNGRLPTGELKITAAKNAVIQLARQLPDSLTMAFRAYGHQSPREKKDCQDTALLVGFANLKDIRAKIVAFARSLNAKGYTPITYVLGLAADDFPKDAEVEKIIVLVSDGKETCEADPCLAARKLKENDIRLTIHTIGFGVDTATRIQLDCIARATGGKYFDANSMEELISVLSEAIQISSEMVIEKKGKGWLKIKGADLRGHEVIDAESGKRVGFISHTRDTLELEAGIYNVTVARAIWRSIEVKPGEVTVIEPGILKVLKASYRGHSVVEAETGEEVGSVSNTASSIALIPGEYKVMFGKLAWLIKIEAGQTIVLNPGAVKVIGASVRGHMIRTSDGQEVGSVSAFSSFFPLPPGDYTIEIGDIKVPFSIKEGEVKEINIQKKQKAK